MTQPLFADNGMALGKVSWKPGSRAKRFSRLELFKTSPN